MLKENFISKWSVLKTRRQFFQCFLSPQKFSNISVKFKSFLKKYDSLLNTLYYYKNRIEKVQGSFHKSNKGWVIGLFRKEKGRKDRYQTSTFRIFPPFSIIQFLKEKPSDFSLSNIETNTTTYKKTQELSSIKLIKCIEGFYKYKKTEFDLKNKYIENCSLQNIDNIFKEFYKRYFIPLYIPILSLIPFLLITSSKENIKFNRLRLCTFLLGLIIVIFSETTIRLITNVTVQNIGLIKKSFTLLHPPKQIRIPKFNFVNFGPSVQLSIIKTNHY